MWIETMVRLKLSLKNFVPYKDLQHCDWTILPGLYINAKVIMKDNKSNGRSFNNNMCSEYHIYCDGYMALSPSQIHICDFQWIIKKNSRNQGPLSWLLPVCQDWLRMVSEEPTGSFKGKAIPYPNLLAHQQEYRLATKDPKMICCQLFFQIFRQSVWTAQLLWGEK